MLHPSPTEAQYVEVHSRMSPRVSMNGWGRSYRLNGVSTNHGERDLGVKGVLAWSVFLTRAGSEYRRRCRLAHTWMSVCLDM